MLDILLLLIPHLPAAQLREVVAVFLEQDILGHSDGGVQKLGYRVLNRLIIAMIQNPGFSQSERNEVVEKVLTGVGDAGDVSAGSMKVWIRSSSSERLCLTAWAIILQGTTWIALGVDPKCLAQLIAPLGISPHGTDNGRQRTFRESAQGRFRVARNHGPQDEGRRYYQDGAYGWSDWFIGGWWNGSDGGRRRICKDGSGVSRS